MQIGTLLVFFCKPVEAVVILGGSIHNYRVWLFYSGLAEFLEYTRSILFHIACEINQRAAGLRTHDESISRSVRANAQEKRTTNDCWSALPLYSPSAAHVSLRNCAENVITSLVADAG